MSVVEFSPVAQGDQPFAAILWDMDGTLADSEPVHEMSFDAACRSLGISLPDNFHDLLLGQSDTETHALLVRDFGLALSLRDWMTLRFKIFMDHIDQVTFFPEAKAIWDQAEARGIPQAVVSNSDRLIVGATLNHLGLARPGMISVTRNDVHRGKPHPDPYLRAVDLMGIAASGAAVMEDSQTGARSGIAAGMSVFVMPHFVDDGTFSVRAASELAALLA